MSKSELDEMRSAARVVAFIALILGTALGAGLMALLPRLV